MYINIHISIYKENNHTTAFKSYITNAQSIWIHMSTKTCTHQKISNPQSHTLANIITYPYIQIHKYAYIILSHDVLHTLPVKILHSHHHSNLPWAFIPPQGLPNDHVGVRFSIPYVPCGACIYPVVADVLLPSGGISWGMGGASQAILNDTEQLLKT